MSRKNADYREALGYCAETCPEVDATFDGLIDDLLPLIGAANQDEARELVAACGERVKEKGTFLLRDALVRACAEKQEAEGDRDELAQEVRRLSSEVDELRSYVRNLESELEAASA